MSDTPTPTSSRIRETRDARLEAIVETATELFATRGFRGTTVAAVAAEVGLTDAGVLHHFPTKRALLMAVLDGNDRALADQMHERLAPGGVEALRRLETWGEVMEGAPHFMGLQIALSTEGLDSSSDLHEYFTIRYRSLCRWLARTIEQAIEAGEVRPDTDAAHEARAFVAVLDGLRLQWYFESTTSIATEVRTYVDHLLDRIATSNAAERSPRDRIPSASSHQRVGIDLGQGRLP